MKKYTAQFHTVTLMVILKGKDVEYFSSLAAIGEALRSRCDNDPHCPGTDESAMATVWSGKHKDVTDIYPDFQIKFGPRGGLVLDSFSKSLSNDTITKSRIYL